MKPLVLAAAMGVIVVVPMIARASTPQDSRPAVGSRRLTAGTVLKYKVVGETTSRLDGKPSPATSRATSLPAVMSATSRIEYDEEEAHVTVNADGSGELTERLLNLRFVEKSGDAVAYELKVDGPSDLRKVANEPRVIFIAGLIEGAVGYAMDSNLAVGALKLPGGRGGAGGKMLKTLYRDFLEARWQFPLRRAGAIAVGESWESSVTPKHGLYSPQGTLASVPSKATTTYLRNEKRGNQDCAVMQTKSSMTAAPGFELASGPFHKVLLDSLDIDCMSFISATDGVLVEETRKTTSRMRRIMGGGEGQMNSDMVVEQTVSVNLVDRARR